MTDVVSDPFLVSIGGLLLTWIAIVSALLKVAYFDPKRDKRDAAEDAARLLQINAERIQNEKEAQAAEGESATQLLKVVDYMIGLIDRLDQRVQKDITQSIEELRRLVVQRVNQIEERVVVMESRVRNIEDKIVLFHGSDGDNGKTGSGT